MNRNVLFIGLAVILAATAYFLLLNEDEPKKPIEVVFYNVENLFDTVDDTTVWDDRLSSV